MRLGMRAEKMRNVAGRPPEPPVVYPHLKPRVARRRNDILHNAEVALPVGVREHMHDKVHIVPRNILHILADVLQYAVSVIGSAHSEFFHADTLRGLVESILTYISRRVNQKSHAGLEKKPPRCYYIGS